MHGERVKRWESGRVSGFRIPNGRVRGEKMRRVRVEVQCKPV